VITGPDQRSDTGHKGQNKRYLNHIFNTTDTSLGSSQPFNTRWGTTEETIGPELQNISRHAKIQPNHAPTYTQITLNTKNSLNSGNKSVGSKYPTQQKHINEITVNRGGNWLRQSQPRPANKQHMNIRTYTRKRQTPTRSIQERGENTHSETQTLDNLWNYTMQHKNLSLPQRWKKLHTHTIAHHRHTTDNPNTLIQEHTTQASPRVGFVNSPEKPIIIELSDQLNSGSITLFSQTQT
jgi:hypothetical protein